MSDLDHQPTRFVLVRDGRFVAVPASAIRARELRRLAEEQDAFAIAARGTPREKWHTQRARGLRSMLQPEPVQA